MTTNHKLINVVVTGAAGFIGQHLVRFLAEQDEVEKIFCYDRKFVSRQNYLWASLPGNQANKIIIAPHSEINYCEDCSIPGRELEFGSPGDRIDAVFHLAAEAGVPASLGNTDTYFANNVQSITKLLTDFRDFGVLKPETRVVAASSSTVYGDRAPPDLAALPPEGIGRPLNPYAASKLAMELALTTSDFNNVRILRLFSVYGPGIRRDLALNKFLWKIENDSTIEIYSSTGHLYRDYTYIDDVIKAFWLAAKGSPCDKQVLNVGTGEPVSIEFVITLLGDLLGKKAKYEYIPSKDYDRVSTRAVIGPTTYKIGWKPEVDITLGAFRLVEAWQNSGQVKAWRGNNKQKKKKGS